LRLCKQHRIPRPEVNAYIEGYLVDFVWRERRLIVEVDGYKHHRSRSKFESDRERDVVLSTRGWRTRRFTWRQMEARPSWVAAMTKQA
jgi:very-short-patch-repair endonuclease